MAVMAHPSENSGLESELKNGGVTFFPNEFLKNTYNPMVGLLSILKIKKTIKVFKPDIVSCHSSFAGVAGRLAIMNKVPTIFTAHGWGFTEGSPFLRRNLLIVLERFVARFCKKIICVSDYDLELGLKYRIASRGKITVIHNGVEDFSLLLKDQNSNLEKMRIVFVGRLEEPKQPELLLQAFSLLPEILKQKSEVSIIGDGTKRFLLKNIISKNNISSQVHLRGILPRGEVVKILSNDFSKDCSKNTIFVLLSKYEGFPRSILEAMSLGIAVVGSNVGGVSEAIGGGVGILVERGDLNGIKQALESLLQDPPQIAKLGELSLKKIKDNFLLETMLEKTSLIYEKVISE